MVDKTEREETEQGYEELTEENSSRLNPSYNMRIEEFLAKSDIQMSDAQFYLYKYEDYLSGEAKALVEKYVECEPPDEHEVGIKYGSGRYILMMYVPPAGKIKKQIRGYRFRVSRVYDKRHYDSQGQVAGPLPPTVVYNQKKDTSVSDAFGMVQSLLATLIPLLRPPESPGMEKMMSNSFNMVNDVMKKQMMNSVQMMNDYQRKISEIQEIQAEGVEVMEGEVADKNPILTTLIANIMPYMDKVLPMLLGGGPGAKAVSAVVRDTEMFKEVTRNKQMLNALIGHLEKEKGKTETEKILKALMVRRPQTKNKGRVN